MLLNRVLLFVNTFLKTRKKYSYRVEVWFDLGRSASCSKNSRKSGSVRKMGWAAVRFTNLSKAARRRSTNCNIKFQGLNRGSKSGSNWGSNLGFKSEFEICDGVPFGSQIFSKLLFDAPQTFI